MPCSAACCCQQQGAADASRPLTHCLILPPQAYADYNDLMDLTEHMVCGLVEELQGPGNLRCALTLCAGRTGQLGHALSGIARSEASS